MNQTTNMPPGTEQPAPEASQPNYSEMSREALERHAARMAHDLRALTDRMFPLAATEASCAGERETTVQSVVDDLVRRHCKPLEDERDNYDRGFEAGRIEDAIKIATRLAGLYQQINDLTRDRDEWKQQHENLLAVRQQDLAALTAKPSQQEAPAGAVKADMFWDAEDGESHADSIDELISYNGLGAGESMQIDRAMRLTRVTVRAVADPDHPDELTHEIIGVDGTALRASTPVEPVPVSTAQIRAAFAAMSADPRSAGFTTSEHWFVAGAGMAEGFHGIRPRPGADKPHTP